MAVESGGARSLDDVLDEIGFGAAQAVVLLTYGLEWALGGSIKMTLGVNSGPLAEEWSLTGVEKGLLVSVVFFGQGCGNLLSGVIVDTHGRRPPILAALWLATFAALGSCTATSFHSMLSWRLLVGVGFGFGTVPFNAIAIEMCPRNRRVEMAVGGNLLFIAGMLLTLAMVWQQDPDMEHLDWRKLTVASALPGLVYAVICHFSLLESPRFLAHVGRRQEAEEVLRRLSDLNEKAVDVAEWLPCLPVANPERTADSYAAVFSRQLRLTTMAVGLSCFVLNFGYYGMLYSLPQVLPDVELHLHAVGNLLLRIVGEVLGILGGLWLSANVSRLRALLVYLLGLGTCVAVFVCCLRFLPEASGPVREQHHVPIALATIAVFFSGFFASIGWLLVYTYAGEVYPTAFRGVGTSVGIAIGRTGSICCPVVYELLYARTGSVEVFFGILIFLVLLNACVVAFLPIETKDRQLGEIEAETAQLLHGPEAQKEK